MASVTYYVVQAFDTDDEGNLAPRPPVQSPSEGAARTLAISLAREAAGVIAFSRTGNPDEGEYSEPTVIHQAGRVPDELE